jgi:hypothetical protein
MTPAALPLAMAVDEPRLGYAVWDFLHALITAFLLSLPLLVVAALGWLVWKRRGG